MTLAWMYKAGPTAATTTFCSLERVGKNEVAVRGGPIDSPGVILRSVWAPTRADVERVTKAIVDEKRALGYELRSTFAMAQVTEVLASDEPFKRDMYHLYWRLGDEPSLDLMGVYSEFAHLLASVAAATFAALTYKLVIEESEFGPSFKVEAPDGGSFRFGFLPDAEKALLTPTDLVTYRTRGLNGFLSPAGKALDGGAVNTECGLIDFAVRVWLAVLGRHARSLEVVCDSDYTYLPGKFAVPKDLQRFAWANVDGVNLDAVFQVLDAASMVGSEARAVREVAALKSKVIEIW